MTNGQSPNFMERNVRHAKGILFSTLIILSAHGRAFAGLPTVSFSDLTDGPVSGWEGSGTKGAAVTIWGNNFGTSRGASTITVCGVTLSRDSDFAEWGATTNPSAARGLQRITFWLNSNMPTGPGTVSVTTPSGASNSIPFYCRGTGNTYFVSPTGSDGNNGKYSTQGSGTNGPWLTATQARASLAAGDVAYFRTGIWNQIDSGSGDVLYFHNNHNDGTLNNSIAMAAYPGEVAQLGDNTITKQVIEIAWANTTFYNWTFSKFVLRSGDGVANSHILEVNTLGSGQTGQWKNFRLVGNDVQTYYNGGVAMAFANGYNQAGSSGLYFYGNYIHDCGADYRGGPVNLSAFSAYGLYIEGYGKADLFDVGWNEFAYNPAKGTAVHVYGHTTDDSIDHLYIHDNLVHHNSKEAIVLGDGDGNTGWNGTPWLTNYVFIKNAWVYNNIFAYNGLAGNENIRVDGGQSPHYGANGGNFYIFNNTFYRDTAIEVTIGWAATPPTALQFDNNIFYSNGASDPYYWAKSDPSAFITGSGYNLYFNNGAGPSWDTHRLDNADPQFVSATPVSYLDFQSQSASPVINAGTSSVSATVMADFLGVLRPQGAGYDIGAYEYVSGGGVILALPPAAPRGFRIQ